MTRRIPQGMTPIRTEIGSCRAAMLAATLAVSMGCEGTVESAIRGDLQNAASIAAADEPSPAAPALDGSLHSYVAFALANSPELRGSFERWRTAALLISEARRLPEPVIKYSYFIRSIETRVGPQRHRLSLTQSFPWPTALSAGADAASSRAHAAQEEFEAEALDVRRAVADAYWRLWLVEEEHRLTMEHDLVLETLAGTVRGRVRTGEASLADLNQVELGIARHHDHHGAHQEAERVAAAELVRAMGADAAVDIPPCTDMPSEGLPVEGDETLREDALQHPRIEATTFLAESSQSDVRVEAAARAPWLVAGLDWIAVGDAPAPAPADSGKDAVSVTAGLSLPLWGRSYRDSMSAARAQGAAYRADRDAARDAATAALTEALSGVRDAQRRIELYRDTLIPQAETTFQSVLGGYQTGRSTVAAALLAQRDLLELQLDLARNRARHARAWAFLESIVGRAIAPEELGERP